MTDESHDAAAGRIDDQEDDARARDLFSQPEKLAELIGELRRRVAASNDPEIRVVLQELEAATNMTAARRVMGGVTMLPDPKYPGSDIWKESLALIEGALAKTGSNGDLMEAWRRTLDHHGWHGKKKFLTASIAHCKWFAGWLLGQGHRDDDAAVYNQLAIDLSFLRAKEKGRRRSVDRTTTGGRSGSDVAKHLPNRLAKGEEALPSDSPLTSGEQRHGKPDPAVLLVTPVTLPKGSEPHKSLSQKRRGAPSKPEAEKTRIYWAKIGKPLRLDAKVCDVLAEHSYPNEYAKAKLHTPARKRLRDRVSQQVRRLLKASVSAAT